MRSSDYACAVIIQEGKILLGRRAEFRRAYPNHWDIIGGRVESGETLELALARELAEELGIKPKNALYLEPLRDMAQSRETPPTYHLFALTQWEGGIPRMENAEHSHLDWFSLQQIKDLKNLALSEYIPIFDKALDYTHANGFE